MEPLRARPHAGHQHPAGGERAWENQHRRSDRSAVHGPEHRTSSSVPLVQRGEHAATIRANIESVTDPEPADDGVNTSADAVDISDMKPVRQTQTTTLEPRLRHARQPRPHQRRAVAVSAGDSRHAADRELHSGGSAACGGRPRRAPLVHQSGRLAADSRICEPVAIIHARRQATGGTAQTARSMAACRIPD